MIELQKRYQPVVTLIKLGDFESGRRGGYHRTIQEALEELEKMKGYYKRQKIKLINWFIYDEVTGEEMRDI